MTLQEFNNKYPELKEDINNLTTDERYRLFEEWGGVCGCGGDGNWCCWDPRED